MEWAFSWKGTNTLAVANQSASYICRLQKQSIRCPCLVPGRRRKVAAATSGGLLAIDGQAELICESCSSSFCLPFALAQLFVFFKGLESEKMDFCCLTFPESGNGNEAQFVSCAFLGNLLARNICKGPPAFRPHLASPLSKGRALEEECELSENGFCLLGKWRKQEGDKSAYCAKRVQGS